MRSDKMSQSFSTDLVPVADRLDAWLCNAKQVCGDCRFHFPRRFSFHGSIERRTLAGLELTRFSSTPVSFAKFPLTTATAKDGACIVITQLEGVRRFCQAGAMAVLKPGDTTLVDSGRPWTSDCAGHCTRLYLRIPRWLVQDRLQMVSLPVLPRIPGTSGLGAVLFRLAASLFEEAEAMSVQEGVAAIEAYLDMLAGCVGSPVAASTKLDHYAELCSRVQQFIETHLPEPTLNPTEIAAAVGVCVRHLHRLFAAKGCTVAEWIRERRLERCRTDLSDPRLCERNITDIAFFWGFNDSAHFSRCFKKEFGVSPREFRSHAWTGPWKPGPEVPAGVFLPARRQSYRN
jgi:AraC family transcriptional regulator, positive regulator of tynA and feaB